MKLSELLNKLEILMEQEGDQDVYVINGCGCCEWTGDPNPRVPTYYRNVDPGVYLNG